MVDSSNHEAIISRLDQLLGRNAKNELIVQEVKALRAQVQNQADQVVGSLGRARSTEEEAKKAPTPVNAVDPEELKSKCAISNK